eukprot:CAMPEP_0181354184 /NCGR_PEP_ID=MMETSP1106-20121128/3226_1 /TAXON_ID=81844 /ORGANISM="Mantoniella antarctica, Strain SL-175" /LENGTH=652 /DNA_ID=CAMNT_0023466831 /DNA_START=139 /DNA_END=2094 /DNA_ORIENTATION=+
MLATMAIQSPGGLGVGCVYARWCAPPPHALRPHARVTLSCGAASTAWVAPPTQRGSLQAHDVATNRRAPAPPRARRRCVTARAAAGLSRAIASGGHPLGSGGTATHGGEHPTVRSVRSVSASLARGSSSSVGTTETKQFFLLAREGGSDGGVDGGGAGVEEDPSEVVIARPHNRSARARGGSKKAAVTPRSPAVRSERTAAARAAVGVDSAAAKLAAVERREALNVRRRTGNRNVVAAAAAAAKSNKLKAVTMSSGTKGGGGVSNGGGKRLPLLSSEQEQEYGRAIQGLLRIEATEAQLAEESIAEELRREKESAAAAAAAAAGGGSVDGEVIIDDIFSKDFGRSRRKSKAGASRGIAGATGVGGAGGGSRDFPGRSTDGLETLETSRGIGRNRTAPAFRRKLAQTLGFTSSADLRAATHRGQSARRAMVTHNVGLALSIAQDIFGKLNDADKGLLLVSDLALEGCAGLVRAADKFDPSRGYRFSTYGYYWARKYVIESVMNCGRTIRLPAHLCELMQKKKTAVRALEMELGRAPNDDELAGRIGVTRARVAELRQWAHATTSLDAHSLGLSIDGDEGDTFAVSNDGGMFTSVDNNATPRLSGMAHAAERDVEADLLRHDLEEAFSSLLPREAFVLRHRFGLASAGTSATGA